MRFLSPLQKHGFVPFFAADSRVQRSLLPLVEDWWIAYGDSSKEDFFLISAGTLLVCDTQTTPLQPTTPPPPVHTYSLQASLCALAETGCTGWRKKPTTNKQNHTLDLFFRLGLPELENAWERGISPSVEVYAGSAKIYLLIFSSSQVLIWV